MSATIAGGVVLLLPEPQAIFDPLDESYRFYYRYKALIPLPDMSEIGDAVLAFEDPVEIEDRTLLAEIWIAAPSPTMPFMDGSLVYLRGRIVLPIQGTDDDALFTLYVEAIHVRARRIRPTTRSISQIRHRVARPEAHPRRYVQFLVLFLSKITGSKYLPNDVRCGGRTCFSGGLAAAETVWWFGGFCGCGG